MYYNLNESVALNLNIALEEKLRSIFELLCYC